MTDITWIYTFLGELLVFIAILIVILFIIALVFGRMFIKKGIVIYPKAILFIIDTLYSPFKSLAKLLKLNEHLIDNMSIEIRNDINKKKFKQIPAKETIIFLPHCLRHRNCPATLQKEGSIGVIKKNAEPKGYKIYIVPGSSFVKKIVRENKFKAVIGVACHEDLNQVMMLLSDFCPQGALLKKTGCYETKVDVSEVLEIINSKDQS